MLLSPSRNLKIADFGVARVEAMNPSDMTGETGTLGYMAPEVGVFNKVVCQTKSLAVISFNHRITPNIGSGREALQQEM